VSGPSATSLFSAAMPGIGHNGPPVAVQGTVLQQIEAIVDSDLPATEKLCAVKFRLRVDRRTLSGAYPSYATLCTAASVKDPRTVQAAVNELCKDGLLVRTQRPGQSSAFGFSPEQLDVIVGDWVAKKKAKHRSIEPPSSDVPRSGSKKDSHPAVTPEEEVRAEVSVAFDEFVATAGRCDLPVPRKADHWVTSIRARLSESGVEGWRQMLVNVERSSFLCGGGEKGWKADLDWLVKPKNFAKVLSGKYGNGGPAAHARDDAPASAELDEAFRRADEEDAKCAH
jgi:hypothetical protein